MVILWSGGRLVNNAFHFCLLKVNWQRIRREIQLFEGTVATQVVEPLHIVEFMRGMRLLPEDRKDFKVLMHTRDTVRDNGYDWRIAERIPRRWDYILKVEVALTLLNLVRWGIWHVLVSPKETAVWEMSQIFCFCRFFWECVWHNLLWTRNMTHKKYDKLTWHLWNTFVLRTQFSFSVKICLNIVHPSQQEQQIIIKVQFSYLQKNQAHLVLCFVRL